MGLDWVPLGRAQPEYEDEHRRLFEFLSGRTKDIAPFERHPAWLRFILREVGKRRKIVWERFREISILPEETLGAPRVGIDPAADEWLVLWYEQSKEKRKGISFDKYKSKWHSHPVIQLAPGCHGVTPDFPGTLGPETFRAKLLGDERIVQILGQTFLERAWYSFTPEEMTTYSRNLHGYAQTYAERFKVQKDDLTGRSINEMTDEQYGLAILLAAARWGHYWSSRGHPVLSDF